MFLVDSKALGTTIHLTVSSVFYFQRTHFLQLLRSHFGPSFRLPPQLRAEVSTFIGIKTIYNPSPSCVLKAK